MAEDLQVVLVLSADKRFKSTSHSEMDDFVLGIFISTNRGE